MHSRQPDSLSLRSLLSVFRAVAFLAAISQSATAQVDRAELEGTVTDCSGSVIAGANIKSLLRGSREVLRPKRVSFS